MRDSEGSAGAIFPCVSTDARCTLVFTTYLNDPILWPFRVLRFSLRRTEKILLIDDLLLLPPKVDFPRISANYREARSLELKKGVRHIVDDTHVGLGALRGLTYLTLPLTPTLALSCR